MVLADIFRLNFSFARADWSIVALTFWIQLITVGAGFYAFSALLVPISESLEISRFEISLAITVQVGATTLAGALAGKLISEVIPIDRLMQIGAALLAFALICASQITEIIYLVAWIGVVAAVGMAFLGPIPCNTLLIDRFTTDRGKALGLSALGATLGGTVFVPLASWLELSFSWRDSFVVLGIIVVIFILPATFFIPSTVSSQKTDDSDEHSIQRYLKNPQFWLLVGILAFNISSIVPVLQLLHSHTTDKLGSVALAALAASILTFCGAVAKPTFGFIADRVGVKQCMAVCIAAEISGLIFITFSSDNLGMLTGAVLFGFGYGGLGPLLAMLVPLVFSPREFPLVIGYVGAICFPLNMLGLPFATWIQKTTGSYDLAFSLFVLSFAISGVLLYIIRIKSSMDHESL